jgi:hypothetical protein
MSRDILVRKFDPDSASEEDQPYEQPEVPESLGTTAELRAAIARVLPGADWFKEVPPAVDEPTEGAQVPLGSMDEVKAAISKVLPEVDWSEPGWGFYERDGICLEFNLEEDDPVEALMIQIRGGNPGAVLLALARATNWSFFDLTYGKYLKADA